MNLESSRLQKQVGDLSRKHIALLASNNIENDTRVKKIANSLAENGFKFSIIGVENGNTNYKYNKNFVYRAPYLNYWYRLASWPFLGQLERVSEMRLNIRESLGAARERRDLAAKQIRNHDALLADLVNRGHIISKFRLIIAQGRQINRIKRMQSDFSKNLIEFQKKERRYIKKKSFLVKKIKGREKFYNMFKYAFNHINLNITFRETLDKIKPDIVHANDLLTLHAAVQYKKRTRKPVAIVYDSHELEMHRNKAFNFMRNLADQWFEWRGVRNSATVITVSEGIADWLQKAYAIPRPFVVLNSPRMPNSDLVSPTTIKRQIGLHEGDRLVVYTGVVTMGRGLELLVKSLMHAGPRTHVALLGPRRADRDEPLLALASRCGVSDRFHLLDPIEPELVPTFIAEADLFINPAGRVTLSYDLALPNKLFDAVFARLPIVVGKLTEMERFVESEGVGISRDLSNHKKIGAAIREALMIRDCGGFDQADWDGVARRYSWERQQLELFRAYGVAAQALLLES
jgi:hypothetical protein